MDMYITSIISDGFIYSIKSHKELNSNLSPTDANILTQQINGSNINIHTDPTVLPRSYNSKPHLIGIYINIICVRYRSMDSCDDRLYVRRIVTSPYLD